MKLVQNMKNTKSGQMIRKAGICFVVAAFAAVLVWRIQCSISYYDEVFNIYISYLTAVLGKRHLVENTYIFSMGNLFNLPFVYLFYHLTGGTEGIVLFIRFVYLGFNLVLACAFYKMFGEYFGKKNMILFGLILVSLFPGGMYTVCYDTAALFFSLLGGVLLLGSEIRGNEKTGMYRYFAGLCHACMVYSYPLMAAVVLAVLIGLTIYHICSEHMKWKELFQYWLPYFLGGITVLGIFVIYVIYVGWENIFFFKKGFVQNSLGGREIGEIAKIASDAGSTESAETAEGVASAANAVMANSPFAAVMKKIGTQTYELLNYMWIQQKATLGVTLVMLFQWGIGLVKKGKWRLLLIPEILLVAFFSHTKISCYGGTTMYAYCFCWAPFLLCYLEKEEKRQGVLIFLILGLISAASFMAIGFTSIRTDKAHVGLYCGAMCTFLLMVMLARKEYFAGVSLSAMAVLMIAVCTMGMGYIDHFQGADIADCTYRMEKGIFKGMMTWEQDVQYENLRTCLEGFQDKEEATISITNWNYYAACLEGDLMERGGMNWLSYWEEMLQSGVEAEDVYGRDVWPDAVLIEKDEEENYRNLRKTILAEHFELVLSEYDYYLYIKKDDI